jgi:hypothetical protein
MAISTQPKKSNVATKIRAIAIAICDLADEVPSLSATTIANGFIVGGTDPIVDDNMIGENASVTAAQLMATLAGIQAFATTYASGTGARNVLERSR